MFDACKPEAFSIIQELALEAMGAKRLRDMKVYLDEIHAVARYQFDVIGYKKRKRKKTSGVAP